MSRGFKQRPERCPLQVGTRFGRLVVTSQSLSRSEDDKYVRYECTCDCGTITFPRKSSLVNGDTKSCGCVSKEKTTERVTSHGMSKHPLYTVWLDMNRRCFNSKRKDYKHYGGRGITVLPEWQGDTGLHQFIQDMYSSYREGLELDRINVDGNYCKDNCRWTTRRQQVINRRQLGHSFDTHYIEYKGEKLCISQWADRVGVPASMIGDRITKLSWTVEKALTTPPKIRDSKVLIGEKSYEPKEIFKHIPNVHSVARGLGLTVSEYIYLLFKGIGELRVYVCKEWITFSPTRNLDGFNIYSRKVPVFTESFKGVSFYDQT